MIFHPATMVPVYALFRRVYDRADRETLVFQEELPLWVDRRLAEAFAQELNRSIIDNTPGGQRMQLYRVCDLTLCKARHDDDERPTALDEL